MLSRCLLVCLLLLAAAVIAPGRVLADTPPGPRLAVVKLRQPGWTQLLTVDPLGGARESIYALSESNAPPAVYVWSAPSWSPDGTQIAFTVLDEQLPEFGSTGTSLARISADGGPVKAIPDTANGFEPVFSPDGHTIAFSRQREFHISNPGRDADGDFESVSVWLADLETGKSRPLTPWRNDLFLFPSSFSPDGSRLALSRRIGEKPPDAVEIGLDGNPIGVFARNAYEPVYSPDGNSVAFLRGPWKEVTRHHSGNGRLRLAAPLNDIFIVSPTGTRPRRVTHTKRAVEEAPRWDPSGQRLAYTEWRPFDYGSKPISLQEAIGFGFGKAVRMINTDGTCPTTVLSGLRSMHYAAVWQPGPGREAGRIAC
jgi:Tol biopolymer transport system component